MDRTLDRTFRSYLAPDLLILDDLGLTALDLVRPQDFYELVVAKHRSSSFVITSNRSVEECLLLFADPMLGNSALDRLANNAYQVVIEGQSYRRRLSPHLRLMQRLNGEEGDGRWGRNRAGQRTVATALWPNQQGVLSKPNCSAGIIKKADQPGLQTLTLGGVMTLVGDTSRTQPPIQAPISKQLFTIGILNGSL